ncbi:PREDICTED: organic cation/carnitine transporter 3-like [Nelumbo nucifera]|uniref:Polyol transporter 5-like n=2 Tax=Nelumbo nucifera TaxID=4432 RepID=A0A822ZBY1_NELNU|nr:PREDICTED: organic cation/carnitine transporter 3-like [Nelumbo nucifera]DAD41181.1 TPA_asm: hypothetical protein HUJ06_015504 [Nelumbo nucifera]
MARQVRESPRWLLVKGRKDEVIKTLRTITTRNQSSFRLSVSFSGISIVPETFAANLYSAIKALVEKKWAFRRLMAVMTVDFGIGMVYYGMPLGVRNLAFSLYLSVHLQRLIRAAIVIADVLSYQKSEHEKLAAGVHNYKWDLQYNVRGGGRVTVGIAGGGGAGELI